MIVTTRPQQAAQSILALLWIICTLASSTAAGPLDSRMDQMFAQARLGNAKVAISIVDLDTSQDIGEHNSTNLMIPASNMKLLSTGAALLILGDDFVFKTTISISENDNKRTLIIKGSGDPALGDPAIFEDEHQVLTHDALFNAISKALKDRSIESIDDLVVDDRIFDRIWTHPCWPIDQLNRWYCAQVGGLNFQTNVIKIFPIPGSPGGTPMIEMQPDLPWIDIQIKAKSINKGRDSAWVARPTQANRFTLYGNVRGKTEIPVSIHNPPEFTGQVFAKELDRRNITINPNGSIKDAVRLATPSDHWESKDIAVITTPITDILKRTNTDSHNLYAEALLKRIGHEITGDPGSWENGASVLRLLLSEHVGATAAQNTVILDGSGMCRDNKVSTRTLTTWMTVLARKNHWNTFQDSLATPGTGTLKRRFTKTKLTSTLYAKSGYLNGVYALSGILQHPSGKRAAFSIILNNIKPGSGARAAKPFIEDVVVEIDQWLQEESNPFGG